MRRSLILTACAVVVLGVALAPAASATVEQEPVCTVNGSPTRGIDKGDHFDIEGTPANDVIKCYVTDLNDGEESVIVYAGNATDNVDGGEGADKITLTGGKPPLETCDTATGEANGNDVADPELAGKVLGGPGLDTITLTGGRNSDTGRQAPSNDEEGQVDGGATCVFSPESISEVANCS